MRTTLAPGANRDLAGLTGWVTFCLVVVALNGWATAQGVGDWYPTLVKPGLTPPNGVFPPVWTALFVLMGIAAWRVWRLPEGPARRRALLLFAVQLGLNLLWSILFFTLRSPAAALADIALLWLAILATLVSFWRLDRAAGLLLVPYLLWVTFAGYLNVGIVRLN